MCWLFMNLSHQLFKLCSLTIIQLLLITYVNFLIFIHDTVFEVYLLILIQTTYFYVVTKGIFLPYKNLSGKEYQASTILSCIVYMSFLRNTLLCSLLSKLMQQSKDFINILATIIESYLQLPSTCIKMCKPWR